MELRQLATFRVLAETLNFTRAAARLNYAQSSVTAQIQALEEELGVHLFDRLGRHVTITDAGQRFLAYAERVLALVDEGRSAVGSDDGMVGTLTIAAPESLCTYRLPSLLHAYRTRYPAMRLLFRPGPVADIRRKVSEGEADVAFVLDGPIRADNLMVQSLASEPVALVAAPDHPLAALPSVGPRDVQGEYLLLTEPGCSYRRLFERALAEAGVTPATALDFNGVEAIKKCVAAGMGISVLPMMAVGAEVERGELAVLRWHGPSFDLVMQMLSHRQKWLSPPLRAFLDLAREVLSDGESTHALGERSLA